MQHLHSATLNRATVNSVTMKSAALKSATSNSETKQWIQNSATLLNSATWRGAISNREH